MFVIQPADEMILYTYGNLNMIPIRRPTLDRLEGSRVRPPPRSLPNRAIAKFEAHCNNTSYETWMPKPTHTKSRDLPKTPTPKTPSKLSKLHIPGFNKSAAVKTPETPRIKEEYHLQITNPTFTGENLRERNYDAFFASGEAVMSRVDIE